LQSTKCRVAALTDPSARKIRQSATNLRRDAPIDSCRMQKDVRRVTARSGTRKAAVIYRLALRDRVRFDKSQESGTWQSFNFKYEKSINVQLHRQQTIYSRLRICADYFSYDRGKERIFKTGFLYFVTYEFSSTKSWYFFNKNIILIIYSFSKLFNFNYFCFRYIYKVKENVLLPNFISLKL